MANRTASTKTNGTAARSVRERIGRADRVHRATSADGTASGDAADHSIERNVEDVTAFVESIGAPVVLAGLAEEGRLVDAARDWMTEWANGEAMKRFVADGHPPR